MWSSKLPNRPVNTSRIFGSLAHSCFSALPRTTSPTVLSGFAKSTCDRSPIFAALDLVTRPESGGSKSAITFIRVLLPEPFRPTIPMRSPSETPSETEIKSSLISKAFETSSKLTILRAMAKENPFS